MWKDFFYFSRTERQGTIVLIVLIIGICGAYYLFSSSDTDKQPLKDETFEKEYNEFVASLQKTDKKTDYSHFSSYTRRSIKLSVFDPNTADSITFLNLGLPSWMAKNILRYRAKGGKFHHPEDFKKVYGLTPEQYAVLAPYINIAERLKKDTTGLLVKKEIRDTIYKYPAGTIIDLNKADTSELKKIPGIGSRIAQMIVNYRQRLGQFYRIEQLQEIHLIADKLRPWFFVHEYEIKRINLNKSGLERLMSHPYINYYQAKVIMEFRKKKGLLKSLKQLSLYEEFTPEDFERLEHYVCFN